MYEEKKRTAKPFPSRFAQQRLPHFSPQHSAQSVVICLFAVSIIFVPIGAAVIVASDEVFEKVVRYDDINKCTYLNQHGLWQLTLGSATYSQGCRTRTFFTLPKSLQAPINMYYRINGFQQNYRQYGKSKSTLQWQGNTQGRGDITDCQPFGGPGEYDHQAGVVRSAAGNASFGDIVYHPCGSIAWSMFNDSIDLYRVPNVNAVNLSAAALDPSLVALCVGSGFTANGTPTSTSNLCSKKGIALSSDTDSRFRPSPPATISLWTGDGFNSDNPFQQRGYYLNEMGHKLPTVVDEDFMVWARLAAGPDFRKLYRRIDANLAAATYLLDIQEYFDTTSFSGEKYIVLATTNWIGGQNYVMGILFIVMGCFSFVLAIAFLAFHMVKSR